MNIVHNIAGKNDKYEAETVSVFCYYKSEKNSLLLNYTLKA